MQYTSSTKQSAALRGLIRRFIPHRLYANAWIFVAIGLILIGSTAANAVSREKLRSVFLDESAGVFDRIFRTESFSKQPNTTISNEREVVSPESRILVGSFFPNTSGQAGQLAAGSCTMAISDTTVAEGDGAGPTDAVFTVSISGGTPDTCGTVTVNFATSNNTAVAPGDYTAASGTVTFNAGETSKTITVTVNGDCLQENNENYFVTLSNPVNATLSDSTGLGTITSEELPRFLNINDVTVAESDSGTVDAVFTVTVTGQPGGQACPQSATVNFATSNNTAVAPGDYTAASGTVTFNAGETSKTITVTVNGDCLQENNENYFVTLSNPVNATLSDSTGLGTITSEELPRFLNINDVTVAESDSGTVDAVFTVTVTGQPGGQACPQSATVNFATSNNTAVAPGDYTAASGTVTFNAGETSKTITVTVNGDCLQENNENYFVTLSNPVNATLSDSTGLGTITSEELPRFLNINDVTVAESDSGTVDAVFTVTVTGQPGGQACPQSATVNFATSNNTAVAPGDYTAASGTVTFNAGETSKTITVTVNGDCLQENNENYFVTLSNPVNATLSDSTGLGTITSEELPRFLNINDVTVAESDSGTVDAVFTVTVTGQPGGQACPQSATVNFATSNNTAVAPGDYTAASGTVTFNAGETSRPINISINADAVTEANENYFVTLSNPVNATLSDSTGLGTITPPVGAVLVTNTADSGAGSLRQAIIDANSNADASTISFNIPGGGPHTINLLSDLPDISTTMTINAATQPGSFGTPIVELNGANIRANGFVITANNCVIRGFIINRFVGDGIFITGSSNTIAGNFIGTDRSGTMVSPVGFSGVYVAGGSGNTIGGGSTVDRNVISGSNDSDGSVEITGGAPNTIVRGNYIGTNAAGTAALGGGGIVVRSFNNTIGGTFGGMRNLISGNFRGVVITAGGVIPNYLGTNAAGTTAERKVSGNAPGIVAGASGITGNVVQGNYIGTNAAGTAALPNAGVGVIIDNSDGNTIGGTQSGAGNLISGNNGGGVSIQGTASGNMVQGNFIGTDVTGTSALGNVGNGIGIDSPNNTIGGTTPAARNIISGNQDAVPANGTGHGIVIGGTGATGNNVQGNYIGTDVSGSNAIPNARGGVFIFNGAFNNAVGGLTATPGTGPGNLLSGNAFDGISIQGTSGNPAHDNQVLGNLIGTDASGTAALRNVFAGVRLTGNDNVIGGKAANARNIIAFNGDDGVTASAGTGNSILGNSIFSNGTTAFQLGIDLGANGVTPNDTGDADTGANNLQNFPVVTSAIDSGGFTVIDARLDRVFPDTPYRVEFFNNNTECDSSGNGEGRQYLGSMEVNSLDGNAEASLFVQQLPARRNITATATRLDGALDPIETSEFSPCLSQGPPVVLKADYQFNGNLNSSVAGAPAMTNLTGANGANTFAAGLIDGYSRSTVRFPENSGLSVSTAGVIPNDTWTIAALFKLDEVDGQRRIVDFTNGTSDEGGYIFNGRIGESEPTTNPAINAGTYIQVVAVRFPNGELRVYRDGVLRVSDTDGDVISPANILRFFQDDLVVPNEASAGNVARLRLYDQPMTQAQVQALDRLPNANGGGDQQILLSSDRNGNNDVYSMNVDGTNQLRLTDSTDAESAVSWSPNGQKILYGKSLGTGHGQLWTMNPDGSGKILVSQADANNFLGRWSPDNQKILYNRRETGGTDQVWVVNADGNGKVRLTNTSTNDHFAQWSPDGTKIAFGRCDATFVCDLFTMNADGSNQVNLTPGHADDDDVPTWTPDGTKIIFSRGGTTDGFDDLFSINPDGSNLQRLTTTVLPVVSFSHQGQKSVSSDGVKVGYNVRDTSVSGFATSEIYTVDVAGGTPLRLTNNSVLDGFTSWSPDGQKILFESRRETNLNEVYSMNRDGTLPVRLTVNSSNEIPIDWRAPVAPAGCPPAVSIGYGQSFVGELDAFDVCGPDFYTFAGTAGELVALTMESTNLNTSVALRDPEGAFIATGSSGGGPGNSRIPNSGYFTLPATGTYEISASGQFAEDSGTYTLSLFEAPVVTCTYSASPSSQFVTSGGGTFFFDVLTQTGCPPAQAPGGSGTIYNVDSYINGRVTYTVAANTTPTTRNDTITVAGQTHAITQYGTTPPVNDTFANGQAITGTQSPEGAPITSVNTNAGAEAGEPVRAGQNPANSVWYSFTPQAGESGLYSFSTSGSSFDTVLAIYACPAPGAGCTFANMVEAGSNDDTTNFDVTSKVNFRATAGVEYRIVVDGKGGATGTIQLSWRRYERLYRLYLQTFNGDPSPIEPDSITASNGTTTRDGRRISQGVYEFDLPADGTVYTATITGPAGIVWNPNNFPLDTSFGGLNELMEGRAAMGAAAAGGGTAGGQNFVTNAQNETPKFVNGFISGIAAQDLATLKVTIGSSRGANPVDPTACTNSGSQVINFVSYAQYQCMTQPNTLHDIVPGKAGKKFTISVKSYDAPITADEFGLPQTAYFAASDAPTFDITGTVTAGGAGTDVDLSYTPEGGTMAIGVPVETNAAGFYEFRNLAPGTYTVTAERTGFVFNQPPPVVITNASAVVDITPQVACTYGPESPIPTVSGAGGAGQFNIVTNNPTCEWAAAAAADTPWITINSGASVGRGAVLFTAAANPGGQRVGTITAGGQNIQVTQGASAPNQVAVTIQTVPAGLQVVVDNVTVTGGTALSWTIGSEHTLSSPFIQGGNQTRFVFSSWSDGGAISHTVTAPAAPLTITATFSLQHFLTMTAESGGTVVPASGWFNQGQSVTILATAKCGQRFSGWTGMPYTGPDNPRVITINAPATQTASFISAAGGVFRNKPYDFDCDGRSDVSLFRPSDGGWYLLRSSEGFFGLFFGQSGDIPVPADYDGDGKTDIAVYRNGEWYVFQSSNNTLLGIIRGTATDIPQPGDYTGDGRADFAYWRPSTGRWHVFDLATGGQTEFDFGGPGDKPVAADYDGDGKTDYAVYRPSDGGWYQQRSTEGFYGLFFGASTDQPTPADYDGDGRADIAVFRPSDGGWYLQRSRDGFFGLFFGAGEDKPAAGDYDGDGKADIAVYRPSQGAWYIQQSTLGFTGYLFGASEDMPAPNSIVPRDFIVSGTDEP